MATNESCVHLALSLSHSLSFFFCVRVYARAYVSTIQTWPALERIRTATTVAERSS